MPLQTPRIATLLTTPGVSVMYGNVIGRAQEESCNDKIFHDTIYHMNQEISVQKISNVK